MKKLCYELLKGALDWDGESDAVTITFDNQLPLDVRITLVPSINYPDPISPSRWLLVEAGKSETIKIASTASYPFDDNHFYAPGYYAVRTAATGGVVDVFECCSGQPENIALTNANLNIPNDIGPIPVPTTQLVSITMNPPTADSGVAAGGKTDPFAEVSQDGSISTIAIPCDSPRIVVGCGLVSSGDNSNIVLREQYWDRQGDSVCLAGKEKRTVSYTVTQGKQETSSYTDTIAESLSTSVNAGWGPVSASLSASLSKNTTSFQQVTVSEQTTSYVSHTIKNPNDVPVTYFRWQLMDVITVFDKDEKALSTLVMAESPNLVMGPYWVSATQTNVPETKVSLEAFEYE